MSCRAVYLCGCHLKLQLLPSQVSSFAQKKHGDLPVLAHSAKSVSMALMRSSWYSSRSAICLAVVRYISVTILFFVFLMDVEPPFGYDPKTSDYKSLILPIKTMEAYLVSV